MAPESGAILDLKSYLLNEIAAHQILFTCLFISEIPGKFPPGNITQMGEENHNWRPYNEKTYKLQIMV